MHGVIIRLLTFPLREKGSYWTVMSREGLEMTGLISSLFSLLKTDYRKASLEAWREFGDHCCNSNKAVWRLNQDGK